MDGAVADGDPFARLRRVQLFLMGADGERIIGTADDAVADDGIAAAADMNAVHIRQTHVAINPETVDPDPVAIQNPHGPAGGIKDQKIREQNITAADKQQSASGDDTIAFPLPDLMQFQFPVVCVMKGMSVSVDGAASGDGDVVAVERINQGSPVQT